ncbi:MAG: septal ring lytic transglycosylase RlpA family protein [Coriobacteriia bacterium]
MKVRKMSSKPAASMLFAFAIALSLVAGTGFSAMASANAVTVEEATSVGSLAVTSAEVVQAKVSSIDSTAISTVRSVKVASASLKKSSPKTVTVSSNPTKAARTAAYKAVQAAKVAARVKAIVPLTGWKSAKVSWYGPGFYGNTMAGGGQLTPTSMVVAHRSMKFGTKIQFTYKGKSVVAVVKDRGPYVSGRTFDLGPGTAKSLGFSGVGTVSWRVVK